MPPPAAAIFSLLLILTGAAKLRRPRDTARALSAMGLPAPLAMSVALAVTEVGIGLAALVTSSPAAFLLQAILYLAFLAWVWIALARGLPIASCGCLGRDDTPPHSGHLVLNVVAVTASVMGAILGTTTSGGPLEATATVLVVGAGAWLGWSLLDEGARVAGLIRR